MTFEIMLLGLLIVSSLTGLTVQGIKVLLDEGNIKFGTNALAGIVSIILSIAVSIGYCILSQTSFTAQMSVYLIALTFLSWLCSMIGYDKVTQVISQFKSKED